MRATIPSTVLKALSLATLSSSIAMSEPIAENNKAAAPPLFPSGASGCTLTLMFKPVFGTMQPQHAYVVVDNNSGQKLELRGGPSMGRGSGNWVPGLVSSGAGPQPTGNPFSCSRTDEWGFVVPYIGRHGALGTNSSGESVYSPDGNVAGPTWQGEFNTTAQPNACTLANCLMGMFKALGASCKPYFAAGTAKTRNSNTMVSAALAACGVADPKPASVSAPGWGTSWD